MNSVCDECDIDYLGNGVWNCYVDCPLDSQWEEIRKKREEKRKYNMTEQTIEIDCAPGGVRPEDLIADVIEGTGLQLKESSGIFFGKWDYNDVDPEVWIKANPVLKERLTKLYNSGTIRYASW